MPVAWADRRVMIALKRELAGTPLGEAPAQLTSARQESRAERQNGGSALAIIY
jgi:hypothetical protein